jgi:uncharacterized membrane protein
LVLASVVPSALFLLGRRIWGLDGGVAMALAWNGAWSISRLVRGRGQSIVMLAGSIGLTLRGAVAVATGSARVFFLLPAIVTALTGLVFLASAFTSTPLVSRFARELLPSCFRAPDPTIRRLLRAASGVWGAEQVLVATVSAWMVLDLSPTTYIEIHDAVSWAVCASVVGLALPFYRRDLREVLRASAPAARRFPVAAAPA